MTKTKEAGKLVEIGTKAGGGFIRSHFLFDMRPRALISAPVDTMIELIQWSKDFKEIPGAYSWNDGMANTLAMAKAGNKLAKELLALSIGGVKGWYLMSRIEALHLFYSQHHAKIFAKGGAQYIKPGRALWTSTQFSASVSWGQGVNYGGQGGWDMDVELRAVGVRREEVL